MTPKMSMVSNGMILIWDIKWGNKLPLLSEKDNKLPNLKDQKYLPRY